MSLADLLPRVRSILPLNDIAALNRLAGTLCDILEATLAALPPGPPATLVPETIVAPALTPTEFLHTMLLDGPRPATDIKRIAREQHGWRPKLLYKARLALRVKASRRGFGPGGYWIWALPGHVTNKTIYFRSGEWRTFIEGHRHTFPALTARM
jgi:hypothetical protein